MLFRARASYSRSELGASSHHPSSRFHAGATCGMRLGRAVTEFAVRRSRLSDRRCLADREGIFSLRIDSSTPSNEECFIREVAWAFGAARVRP